MVNMPRFFRSKFFKDILNKLLGKKISDALNKIIREIDPAEAGEAISDFSYLGIKGSPNTIGYRNWFRI